MRKGKHRREGSLSLKISQVAIESRLLGRLEQMCRSMLIIKYRG